MKSSQPVKKEGTAHATLLNLFQSYTVVDLFWWDEKLMGSTWQVNGLLLKDCGVMQWDFTHAGAYYPIPTSALLPPWQPVFEGFAHGIFSRLGFFGVHTNKPQAILKVKIGLALFLF